MTQMATGSAGFTDSSWDSTRKQKCVNENNDKNNNSVNNDNVKESTRSSELNESDNRERSWKVMIEVSLTQWKNSLTYFIYWY